VISEMLRHIYDVLFMMLVAETARVVARSKADFNGSNAVTPVLESTL